MFWGKLIKVQNFFLSNRKEVIKIDKDGNESVVTISYKIKFIDSARFTTTSLTNLVDNLTQKEFTKLNVKIMITFLNVEKLKKKINKI